MLPTLANGFKLPPFLGCPTEGGLDLVVCSHRMKYGKRKYGNLTVEKSGKYHFNQVMKVHISSMSYGYHVPSDMM